MNRDDWDVMILHYLGLDHIGHIAGPSSPLIGPKLQEMDDIVKMLHQTFVEQVKLHLIVIHKVCRKDSPDDKPLVELRKKNYLHCKTCQVGTEEKIF